MANSQSLLGCLAELARTRPDSIALVMGNERITYAELNAMARAARARIAALQLPPGGRVAVHAAKSPRTIALIIACLMARQPFLLPSAELGASTFGALLEHAGCDDLLAAEPHGGTAVRVHDIDCTPTDDQVPDQPSGAVADEVSFMLTTSGSTGLPKIVPLTVGAIDRFTDWAATQFDLGPDTSVLNYAPLNFDLCLLDIWATLKAGGTVVLVDQERATSGRYLVELVRTEQVDIIQSVPMLYRLLADAHGAEPFAGVRHVIVTGDKVPSRLRGELPKLFGAARLYNLYGCTETNDSFLHELTGERDGKGDLPIGRPLPGVDALVVGEDGAVVDGPAVGELFVHTPFQTTGYLDSTVGADKFVRLGGGQRPYFRSGDLVRRDAAGVFTLVGRNDFQVKVRGTRVNLEEIEHVFLDHGRVQEAAVVGVPDDIAGVRIHAIVRTIVPGSLDSFTLRDHCRLRLPRAAIPSTIQVVDDPLPMTPTGKVDRRAISHNLLNRS